MALPRPDRRPPHPAPPRRHARRSATPSRWCRAAAASPASPAAPCSPHTRAPPPWSASPPPRSSPAPPRPTEPAEVIRARRMAYYRMMAEAPRPTVAVIEDVDFPACVAAYWGEINTTVHKGLGVAGALTNGVVRDLGDLPDGFPVVAGSIGPSHGFAHLRAIAHPRHRLRPDGRARRPRPRRPPRRRRHPARGPVRARRRHPPAPRHRGLILEPARRDGLRLRRLRGRLDRVRECPHLTSPSPRPPPACATAA